jgi:CO/xanthine dehydrogenase Mo-binding subunit
MAAVGKKVPRKEGIAKVAGVARYVDDLSFPGMLHGATVRSTISSGEILSIRHDLGRDGYTLADFRDIPGRNVVALIEDDQPCLAEREVRHAAEPILLLAHEEKEKLTSPKVEIEYRTAEPVYDPEASPKIFKEILIEKDLFFHAERTSRLVECR